MAEQEGAPRKDQGPDTIGGLPQWALLPMVVAVVVVGYVWYKSHKKNQAANTYGNGTPLGPSVYAQGLATDQASALFAQLQNIQYGISNLSASQAQPTPDQTTNYLPYQEQGAYPLSLNQLSNLVGTTAQAIIDATSPSLTPDSNQGDQATSDYLDAGDFDVPLPQGSNWWLPQLSTVSATAGAVPPNYLSPGGGAPPLYPIPGSQ